jgi:curved DNA-binding protein CbpA
MPDSYSILKLSRRATTAEIKAAYRALAKQAHPDVNAGDGEADRRTKEINRAYEILGDPETRAAYDLKLARQRAEARKSLWSAAAIGAGAAAAAFMLTIATLSVTMTWRQHVDIHQSPGGEPRLLAGNTPSENLDAKPAAEDRANLRSAGLRDSEEGNFSDEPISVPFPAAFRESPISANPEIASVQLRNKEAQKRGEPASQPSPEIGQRPKEEAASALPSTLASEVELLEGQPLPRPSVQNASPRTELASAALPEAGVNQQMPAGMVDRRSSGASAWRAAHRKTATAGRIQNKPGEQINITKTASTALPSQQQELERAPRLVSTSAAALRWPSADEPFVSMGGGSR